MVTVYNYLPNSGLISIWTLCAVHTNGKGTHNQRGKLQVKLGEAAQRYVQYD